MTWMIEQLVGNPLLLLALVGVLGYAIGRITIGGVGLGVSAVLFVGIAIGALDQRLRLPDEIYEFGLVLFVYTVGLSSGRVFFRSLRRAGLRDNALVLALLGVAAGLVWMFKSLLGLSPAIAAGMYSGSLTNTPALAALIQYLKEHMPALVDEPVVAYSITYPLGVIGMILAIITVQRMFKIDYATDATREVDLAGGAQLENRTLRVSQASVCATALDDLIRAGGWDVVFGRHQHNGNLSLAAGDTRFAIGDLISVIGTPANVDTVMEALGERTDTELALDRSQLDYRRMVVSNPRIAGHRLRDLDLPRSLGATITRLRRGDIEMLVHGDTVLELGDRVRVIARRQELPAVAELLGDSYRQISEIDMVSFTLGLVLGLLVGMIPLPLPGGIVLKLGFAGGPLVVALVLGALNRTGPFVWTLPYSANLTIRQLGLVLFLAGIGTRAGYNFVQMLQSNGGLSVFLAGGAISYGMAMTLLLIGYRVMKVPYGILIGMLSGFQTQPALLAFANEQANNELPNLGYSRVFPVALISKIVIAQLLLALLLK